MNRTEVEAFRKALAGDVEDLLDEAMETGEIADPAGLERLASLLASGLRDDGPPPELGEALASLLEERRDEAGATMLAFLPTLVPAFHERADASVAALASRGVTPAIPAGTGELRVREARRFDLPTGAMYLLLIERPGSDLAQVGIVTFASEEVAEERAWGPLGECMLTPWGETEEARALLAAPDDAGSPGTEISSEGVADAIDRALACNREAGRPVRWQTGLALPLLGLALRGDGGAFGGVGILADGMERHVEPDDEDRFARMTDVTLADFDDWLGHFRADDEELAELAPRVAEAMLRFQWVADGRLAYWHEDDVEEFLLEEAPRRLRADDRAATRAADCVSAFLRFLHDIEMLGGAPIHELESLCEELRGEAAGAAGDRARWGPAKTMIAQMEAEGVELTDQAALDNWLEDFNSRDQAERDRILGPAMDADLLRASVGPGARLPDELDAAVLPAKGGTAAVGSAWFPPGEYERALERWRELGDLWEGITYQEYVRRFEATLRGWRAHGVRGRPVRLSIDAYQHWCAERGVDPNESRAAYAADQLRAGNESAWPPGRNDPCWCESGRKYKRCCGTVSANALHPLEADV